MPTQKICDLFLDAALVFALLISIDSARADEGGVSFWLPGQFGSLAAAPAVPGWQFGSVYYHTSLSAGGNVAASRQVTIGGLNPTVNVNLNANLSARADLEFLNANYVFATPVFGGQFAFGMTGAFGRSNASIDGTLTSVVGGITTTRQGSISDSRGGIADLYPLASLRWNQGVNNFMTYLTGDIPVGTYNSSRLANFGIGHGAIDGGVGYTYFNPQTGHEFSVVTGLTYNLENTDTNYRNGIDWHVDWGLSQFLSKQFFIGAVGYFYDQLTADSGAPAILGDNKSRVAGIGPQIGYLFPVGNMQGYLNLKGYKEFAAENRPDGWNVWLTFAVTPAAPVPRH
ncbi:MAG: SphA family protein [Pseudolabrys sp.]